MKNKPSALKTILFPLLVLSLLLALVSCADDLLEPAVTGTEESPTLEAPSEEVGGTEAVTSLDPIGESRPVDTEEQTPQPLPTETTAQPLPEETKRPGLAAGGADTEPDWGSFEN